MRDVDLVALAKTATVPDEFAVGVVGIGTSNEPVVVVYLPGHNVFTRQPEAVTLAMSPAGALDLCREIAAQVQAVAPHRDAFGRPE